MSNDRSLDASLPTAAGGRWLAPSDAFFRSLLALPQLALCSDSCSAERALLAALDTSPQRAVTSADTDAIVDDDARDNVCRFLAFRDAVVAAGTLEAYYLALMRSGRVAVPPLFVDRVVEAIVGAMLADVDDAFERRAGELLHRSQRVAISEGRVLAADRESADRVAESGGFGDLGRLLREAAVPLLGSRLQVLTADNAAAYLQAGAEHTFALDLTHEVSNDVGHGLVFTMTRAHSGLRALARVLERWILRFFAVEVVIRPVQRIDDAAWSWHIGLDAEATALLNDLWRGEAIEPERSARFIGLFRLEFARAAEMRVDLAGKAVHLGLAMTAEQTLKLKPQNLLLDLPLAAPM